MASNEWKYSQLESKYSKIYDRLLSYHNDYQKALQHLSELKVEDEVTRQARIDNFNKQLKDIGEYYAKIEYFRHLAEKNILSKNVISLTPLELDFNSLRHDAARIDPENPDDPYANRLYIHTRCNEIYLSEKQMEFEAKRDTLIYGKNDILEQEKRKVDEAKKRIEESCAVYVKSEEFESFCEELTKTHDLYSTNLCQNETLSANHQFESLDMHISIGAVAQPFPIIGEVAMESAKYRLDKYYDKDSQSVLLPVVYDSSEEVVLDIRTVSSKENRCFRGVTNFLLNKIIRTRPGNRNLRIRFYDAIHYNNAQLKMLRPLEDSAVLDRVPVSEDEIADGLRNVVSAFPDIDDKLQEFDSVQEYNENVTDYSQQIERQLIVLVGYPNAFDNESKTHIKRIIYNHRRYGISLVLVDNIGYGEDLKKDDEKQKRERLSENYFHIDMLQNKSSTIDQADDLKLSFRWYEYDYKKYALSDAFIGDIRKDDKTKEALKNVYNSLFPLVDWKYKERDDDERKKIVVPYGLTSNGEVSSISFQGESFAAYLMGASGSGKSTLLHSIITGILRNYHPDDVELWLADFKMAEFSQYINPRPPHVKYILLDESRELVFDLVDKLTDEMMKRQKYFMLHRDIKKVEDVPASVYMPVIFVILDEFSIMSQVLEDEVNYKLKLQNLLAKGRALGIKFIFSSQSYVNGIRGLTNTAKEQIQTRIAMKNTKEEVTETLQLPNFLKTEQNTTMIETLPVHKALRKFHKTENEVVLEKVNVLYFENNASKNPYEPQKDMIIDIRKKMKIIEEENFAEADSFAYVDKNPVIVDGNSYAGFDRNVIGEKIEKYRKKFVDDIADEDILISFGSPRRMDNYIFSNVSKESRENFLLIGNPQEQSCMASIAMTAGKSFMIQGRKVQVWAYERNRLYKAYKQAFTDLGIKMVVGIDAICDEIRDLKSKITKGINEHELIILFGMDHICIDFDYINNPSVTDNESVKTEKKQEQDKKPDNVTDAEHAGPPDKSILLAMLSDQFTKYWEPIGQKLQSEGKSASELENIKKEYMKKYGVENRDRIIKQYYEELAWEKFNTGSSVNESPSSTEKGAYNAKTDFDFVLKHGSRLGYHFLLALNGLSDLKPMGIKMDYFKYKMTFQISVDDSRTLFNTKIANSLPKHVCQYDDTLDRYSFRPFIHEGIGWDGWNVENGVLISPFDSNE